VPLTWIGEGVLARSSTYRALIGVAEAGAGAALALNYPGSVRSNVI
jgi:hypothetical protein